MQKLRFKSIVKNFTCQSISAFYILLFLAFAIGQLISELKIRSFDRYLWASTYYLLNLGSCAALLFLAGFLLGAVVVILQYMGRCCMGNIRPAGSCAVGHQCGTHAPHVFV